MSTSWRPCGLLQGNPDRPYSVIVLNQPINRNAWNAVADAATHVVCADAGADRLRSLHLKELSINRQPDAIVGDLDSLEQGTENYYRNKGVVIELDPDQYSTDFTKSLKWIRKQCKNKSDIVDVVVLGGLGGRVDQGFSQIHHLYLAQTSPELLNGRIYLLSEQSLTFVLESGENKIVVGTETFQESMGIIPVMGPTRISTKGLEWDVEDWLTEFGGLVSTSNHLRSDEISIDVNGKQPLVTFELAKQYCMSSRS